MNEILSRQNAKFKAWLELLEARGIKKSGHALLSGRKLVEEFLAQTPQLAVEVLLPPKGVAPDTALPCTRLGGELFNALDALGTKSPLLVVQVQPPAAWGGEAPQGLELIVALSDPGNLGALIRSAEAFGVRRVILSQECASPFLAKALKAASGATFRLPLATCGPLNDLHLDEGYCLDTKGEDLARFEWPKDLYLVLGEEGRGVPTSLELKQLTIPMAGRVESLNAAAAAAIAMFCYQQHLAKSR